MKRYAIYKDIRKHAIIFGLPMLYFAVMMMVIILSLLVIIFSFSFQIVIVVLVVNAGLYILLTRLVQHPFHLQLGNTFPKLISNKKYSNLNYD